ncbi:MAG: hypothetical protein GY936_08815 [Ignavibacteriae bacterium]|nr:hypothetical protein [Ignavibacteriota bacterium]
MLSEKYVKILLIIIILSIISSCKKETITDPENNNSEFSNEKKVSINGYFSDAMEPFISKDDRFLFFNNHQGVNSKDIYYAEKINDTTFVFKGEVIGVNTAFVDGNPTMDANNNFYFISTRDLDSGNKTLFSGKFNSGTVSNLHKVDGTINILTPYWINMGVEISMDNNTLFTSTAKFNVGENFPREGNIRFSVKTNDEFNIPNNEAEILININNDQSIQYAGETSIDELELFYSQVTLSNPPIFKLLYSNRNKLDEAFGIPQEITEPFMDNPNAFVEGPSLSVDGKRLYYHKLENEVFSIFMLSR